MNGLFSAHPSPAVLRLLVGSTLLLLVQAGFVLGSPEITAGLRTIVLLIAGIGAGALVLAVRGLPDTPAEDRRFRRGA